MYELLGAILIQTMTVAEGRTTLNFLSDSLQSHGGISVSYYTTSFLPVDEIRHGDQKQVYFRLQDQSGYSTSWGMGEAWMTLGAQGTCQEAE